MNINTPNVFIPPYSLTPSYLFSTRLFLAGSIEMGVAERWQEKVIKLFEGRTLAIYNPRRTNWDASWEQEIENGEFYRQVSWELKALDAATDIIMYFDPNTKSPISLLELGLHARSDKMRVVCPKGFWCKGNVDIICEHYRIKQYETLDEACRNVSTPVDYGFNTMGSQTITSTTLPASIQTYSIKKTK